MSKWREVKLKKVIKRIFSGGTPSTKREDFWGGELLWLSSGETNKKYISDTEKKITELGAKESSTKLAKKNSVVIASAGQGKTRGQVSFLKKDMFINQSIIAIEGDEEYILQKYLLFNLSSRYNEIRILSDASSSRGSITTGFLNKLTISVPNIDTQKKTVNILASYDELIENNNRRIQILEQAAEELYKEWFVRMRFPGHEKTKFDKGIPEGWEVKKLNEFSELVHGYTEKANDNPIGPKFLRGTDINKKSYITWAEVPYCAIDETNYKKHKLQIEDIVIIRMADPGKVAIIEEDVDAVFASYLIKINYDKSKVSPYYLFYTLHGEGYQSQIQSYANGTTRSSINSKMILNSCILLPPNEIQILFNERVLKYRKLLNQFITQNQNLIKQRDLLLPRLMNGTITVK